MKPKYLIDSDVYIGTEFDNFGFDFWAKTKKLLVYFVFLVIGRAINKTLDKLKVQMIIALEQKSLAYW